jgi:hypothetical protein
MFISRSPALLVAAVALATPAAAGATWKQPVAGDQPLNRAASDPAASTSLATVDGVPWVAWVERHDNGEVRAARLNPDGASWDRSPDTASPINESPTADAELPSITAQAGAPCVAWDEFDETNTEVRVACLDAGAWTQIGGGASPVNHDPSNDASHPSLVSFNGVLHVAWSELDGSNVSQIHVARQSGNTWEELPDAASPINRDATHSAHNPSLAVVGTDLYVAWNENDGTSNKVRVSRLNGSAWSLVADTAGGLNENPAQNAADPSLADVGGVPHVAWTEQDGNGHVQVRVAKLNPGGTQWLKVGQTENPPSPINQSFNQSADHPSLTAMGSPAVPYVAWTEIDADGVSQVRVARLKASETGWEKVAGGPSPINNSSEENATAAAIAPVGGVPWVAWVEDDPDSTPSNPIKQARATRLEPEFAAPVATDVTDSGATLGVQATTYGLAYPIAFAYGPPSQTTPPQPAPTGQGDTVTVEQPVAGLAVGTQYDFHPVATAGTPAPQVVGPSGSFTTTTPARPTCADVVVTTTQGAPAALALQCTGEGPLTYAVVEGPSGGALSGLDEATGAVTYTPGATFSGHDSFTYRATNAGGPSTTAQVKLTVEPGLAALSPSNQLSFGAVTHNKRKGTAKIAVTVAAHGALTLAKSKAVKGAHVNVATVTRAQLSVRPTAKTKRKLARKGKAKVKISVTFAPDGGTANTASTTVKLVRKR